MTRVAVITVAVLALLGAGYAIYVTAVVNPRVVSEIIDNPTGERAARVMLLTFPDGKIIPVNYRREGNLIYAGADGSWWRAFEGDGAEVSLLVQGETLKGHATVELDDRQYIEDVFSRLRPTVPQWLPDWANGKLVVVELGGSRELEN